MKLKRLVSTVVVVMLVFSAMMCSAATSTTTSYAGGVYTVSTTVSGIAEGSMVSYILNNGESVTDSSIIYIEQDNNSTGTSSFTAPAVSWDEVRTARVIVGSDAAGFTSVNEDIEDESTINLTANLDWDMSGVTAIKVTYGTGNVATLTEAANTAKIPLGAEYTLELTMADSQLAIDTIEIGGVEKAGTANKFTFTAPATAGTNLAIEVGNTVKVGEAYTIIVSDAIIGTNTISFMVDNNIPDADTGINIVSSTGDKVEGLMNKGENKAQYGIRLVDEIGFITAGATYSAVPVNDAGVEYTKFNDNIYYAN